jgi:4-aminobutyrate aminotransferase
LDGLRALADRHPILKDVRGIGLMIGIEFESGPVADAVEDRCFRRGLLTLRAGDATMRMSPPLVIDADQVEVGLALFEEACAEIAGR